MSDIIGVWLERQAKDGYYFDPGYSPLEAATSISDLDKYADSINSCDAAPFYLDKSYEELAQKAKDVRENTDYFIGTYFGAHLFSGAQSLRGFENFLMDMAADPKFAGALLDRLVRPVFEAVYPMGSVWFRLRSGRDRQRCPLWWRLLAEEKS